MGEWVCICMGHVIVVVVKTAGGLPCHLCPHRAICVPIAPSACPSHHLHALGTRWRVVDVGGQTLACEWVDVQVGGHVGGWTCRWAWCVVCGV